MPRPRKPRTIGFMPDNRTFYSEQESQDWVEISLVELEAIRLSDGMGLDQDAASEAMDISRGTFQRIIRVARHKVADALIHGKNIRLEGGDYAFCEGRGHGFGYGRGRGCQQSGQGHGRQGRGQGRGMGMGKHYRGDSE